MAVRYPVDDWLHVFTDGSQFDCHFNVGAGVFSELFSFYVPAGYIGTAFDGEVVALSTALQQLLALQHKSENAVLFSDSQAGIQSISSHKRPLTPEISRCQDLLRSLFLRGKRIVLQWVPAHCGVWGNEQADLLAKKGANLL
nr:ribonuclease H-like [Parasteatoda tepidariorum]